MHWCGAKGTDWFCRWCGMSCSRACRRNTCVDCGCCFATTVCLVHASLVNRCAAKSDLFRGGLENPPRHDNARRCYGCKAMVKRDGEHEEPIWSDGDMGLDIGCERITTKQRRRRRLRPASTAAHGAAIVGVYKDLRGLRAWYSRA